MENHSPKRHAIGSFFTFLLIGFVNISVGIVGYIKLGVGLKTETNILTAFLNQKKYENSPLMDLWVRIACICLTLSVTINHFFESRCFLASIKKILNGKWSNKLNNKKYEQMILIMFTLAVMSLAMILGTLNDAITLNSVIIASSLIFTLPGIMFVGLMYRQLKDKSNNNHSYNNGNKNNNNIKNNLVESISNSEMYISSYVSSNDNNAGVSTASPPRFTISHKNNHQETKCEFQKKEKPVVINPTFGLFIGYSMILFGVAVTVCGVYAFFCEKSGNRNMNNTQHHQHTY